MRTLSTLFLAGVCLIGAEALAVEKPKAAAKAPVKAVVKEVYMCPECGAVSKKAGTCEVCRVKLVKKKPAAKIEKADPKKAPPPKKK